jgi:hypothetical protein
LTSAAATLCLINLPRRRFVLGPDQATPDIDHALTPDRDDRARHGFRRAGPRFNSFGQISEGLNAALTPGLAHI